ncbi:unnamed protein product [Pleuronectes platessa]|uniref:Uncharacterized protein n=1 Tax=Pleuronectes platessa TaxID=8262 RepID=A0A9N7Z8I5_PLEPL|nr:unnamed protein product [Pleuronectes platessa]
MATNTEIRPWRRRKTEAGRKTHPGVQKGISPRRALSVCAAANSKQRTARLQQQPPSSRPRHVTQRQRIAARKHRDKIKAPDLSTHPPFSHPFTSLLHPHPYLHPSILPSLIHLTPYSILILTYIPPSSLLSSIYLPTPSSFLPPSLHPPVSHPFTSLLHPHPYLRPSILPSLIHLPPYSILIPTYIPPSSCLSSIYLLTPSSSLPTSLHPPFSHPFTSLLHPHPYLRPSILPFPHPFTPLLHAYPNLHPFFPPSRIPSSSTHCILLSCLSLGSVRGSDISMGGNVPETEAPY